MENKAVRKIVIAGGGTAGWMAAAAISKQLGQYMDITLVESDTISTVGVGEATIPTLLAFHLLLGLNEAEFMRATSATFKLGIQFENWGQLGDRYIHSFGSVGQESWIGGFQHFWLKAAQKGDLRPLGEYCLELQAAEAGKFAITKKPFLNYAFHLDATRYAQYLRKISEGYGVKRIEGKIVDVALDSSSGDITQLTLDSGETIPGDLFIDCTGFHGLLIEQTLKAGYEEWSHWLPCDRALAIQTESTTEEVLPFTRSIAHESGWQWRIPLQHRVGNGLVYSSQYMSDEEAEKCLMDNIEGKTITDLRHIKFVTGRRRQGWKNNCIALGLASGFIEPLESTSIHLISSGVIRLMRLLSVNGVSQSAIDEYNRATNLELERVRDFIVLHYHANNRDDSAFWRYCREMEIPESLAHRIALFKETGQVFKTEDELFRIDSWLQVMLGQGIMPQSYHPIVDTLTDEQLRTQLGKLHSSIEARVAQLPKHIEFINQYCGISA